MDDKFRSSEMEVYEFWKSKVLEAEDQAEALKAMTGWKLAADSILKHDIATDQHDENVEKIVNAQENDEKKLEWEQKEAESKKEAEAEETK